MLVKLVAILSLVVTRVAILIRVLLVIFIAIVILGRTLPITLTMTTL